MHVSSLDVGPWGPLGPPLPPPALPPPVPPPAPVQAPPRELPRRRPWPGKHEPLPTPPALARVEDVTVGVESGLS